MAGESPASVLTDEDGNLVNIPKEGKIFSVSVRDMTSEDVQKEILLMLRKIEFHLETLTGNNLDNEKEEEL